MATSSRLGNSPQERTLGSIAARLQLWLLVQMSMLAVLASACHFAHAQANEWTWMGGGDAIQQPGDYGMLGEPAPANIPGGRFYPTQWIDKNGNLWIFGGQGFNASIYGDGFLNDLWMLNTSTREWAWMGGTAADDSKKVCADISICRQPPVYGTLGVAAPENIPGARAGGAGWIDKEGHLWLFGGNGVDDVGFKPGFVFCELHGETDLAVRAKLII